MVLVEGMSDQAAVQTLAERSGRDLRGDGIFVVPMGGATNIGHFVSLFGPGGFGVRLTGLCDQGEERDFRHGLDRVGPYFVCVVDLEDEMIRALGSSRVEELIEAEGEIGPFRTSPGSPPTVARAATSSCTASWVPAPAGRSATATSSPPRST